MKTLRYYFLPSKSAKINKKDYTIFYSFMYNSYIIYMPRVQLEKESH